MFAVALQTVYRCAMTLSVRLFEGATAPASLRRLGCELETFGSESLPELDDATAHWVFVLPEETLRHKGWPRLRVDLTAARRQYIVFGSGDASQEVVQALRDGAFDFVYLSEDDSRWQDALEKAAASQELWLQLFGFPAWDKGALLIGRSPAMEAVRKSIERIGHTAANVLIVGESGTGKERAAQALHAASGRQGPFLAVNCAAIPRDLLEAELFGAEKGAFTGATESRRGIVEQAGGGSLFLDEIGELDISLQPKLLRFLESRQARRVGGRSEYTVDVRIISATNRDLEGQIDRKEFRADLFYRLAEFTLKLPALRYHPEDIPALATHFLEEANERFGKHFVTLEPHLAVAMMSYPWPGNVRELRSCINRMVILHDGPVLRQEWWEQPPARSNPGPPAPEPSAPVPPAAAPGTRLNRRQKWDHARALLRESGNDHAWTAAQLGVHPTTLFRWIKAGKV